MTTEGFFGHQSQQSAVKARIVSKYFWSWAKNVCVQARLHGQPLWYLDLYVGTGRYDDGTASTPIMVLEEAIRDPSFSDLVEAHLSDSDAGRVRCLAEAVQSLAGVETLRRPPVVRVQEVDDELTQWFEETRLPPALSFVDPWGYKGLSLKLVRALTKDWGCDCIFFFNYNRINQHLSNRLLVQQMDRLFGKERAGKLRERIRGLQSKAREQAILDEIKLAIEEDGARRAFPFAFKFEAWDRTSHYVILVTKHPVGRKIMKDIMAAESTDALQGVPNFAFRPVLSLPPEPEAQQLAMFPVPQPPQPLDVLQERLMHHFAGRTLAVKQLRDEFDRVDDRYLERNYREALLRLEAAGRIKVDPAVPARRTRNGAPTLAEWVRVTFPPRSD